LAAAVVLFEFECVTKKQLKTKKNVVLFDFDDEEKEEKTLSP
jgi:hypothetical protein